MPFFLSSQKIERILKEAAPEPQGRSAKKTLFPEKKRANSLGISNKF